MIDNTNIVPGEYRDNYNNKFVFNDNKLLVEMYYETGDILEYKYIWKNNKFVNKKYNESFEIKYCDNNRILLVSNDSIYIALFKKLKN